MITYKKLYKWFVWFLFLSFLVLYFAQKEGYYDEMNNKKNILTEEKIKQFEEDVKNGVKIDVNNYLVEDKKDYSNKVSRFGLASSNFIAKYFKSGLTKIFNGVDKLVNE